MYFFIYIVEDKLM